MIELNGSMLIDQLTTTNANLVDQIGRMQTHIENLWEEVGFVIVEAAVNNLFVFSSDCPNGPKEFLRDGKAGILFRTNVTDELKNKLINFNINDFPSSKILAKKNFRKISAKKKSPPAAHIPSASPSKRSPLKKLTIGCTLNFKILRKISKLTSV